jgi:iron complex transport system permease protein
MDAAKQLNLRIYLIKILPLFFFTIASCIAGLSLGSFSISISDLFSALFSPDSQMTIPQIIYEVRLPRVLMAVAIGGGLSVAGAVFQAVLMNPLAEPYILGISSGAACGTVLSLALGLGFVMTQIFSFSGALAVVFLVFILGKRFGELEPNILLLSGVMVGAFFSAAILMITTFLNESLRTAVFWLMGNLSSANQQYAYFILPVSIVVSFLLTINAQKYNVLSLGTETAKYLGINTSFLKNYTYLLSSILIGGIVSVSGIIGFVGLLVPHVCRMIFGVDNRIVIPASFFIGASYLTLADGIARTVISPAEIPVGAVTAFLGAPVFIYLLRRRFNVVS